MTTRAARVLGLAAVGAAMLAALPATAQLPTGPASPTVAPAESLDIRGTWTSDQSLADGRIIKTYLSFFGTPTRGVFRLQTATRPARSGQYAVEGNSVRLIWPAGGEQAVKVAGPDRLAFEGHGRASEPDFLRAPTPTLPDLAKADVDLLGVIEQAIPMFDAIDDGKPFTGTLPFPVFALVRAAGIREDAIQVGSPPSEHWGWRYDPDLHDALLRNWTGLSPCLIAIDEVATNIGEYGAGSGLANRY